MTHAKLPHDMLKAAVALESLHHDWYLDATGRNAHAENVEWLLERTTCIQKEVLKWLGMFPTRTALMWATNHVNEEIHLIESDLDDISRLLRHISDDDSAPRSKPPSISQQARLEQALEKSTEIRDAMRAWCAEDSDLPSTRRACALMNATCDIQSRIIRESLASPMDLKLALRRAYGDAQTAYRSLVAAMKNDFGGDGDED
jgi:hypothetical protein